jgi:hypothetical protein
VLRNRQIAIALVVVSVGYVAAGCGESSAETTTTVESDVVFGRGSVPETVPDSFPIPEEAVVGATLVDTSRGLTEMILTFPADTSSVVRYYEENLPLHGYEITRSEGSETEWRIDFTEEEVDGVIRVQTGGIGVAAATVQFTER